MYKKFERHRSTNIDEVNKILSFLDDTLQLYRITYGVGQKYKSKAEARLDPNYYSLATSYLVGIKDSKIEITTSFWHNEDNKWAKPCTWHFDLNEEDIVTIKGLKCYAEFNKAAHIPDIKDTNLLDLDTETGKFFQSAKPIIGYRGSSNLQIFKNVYEYDLNSAYASVILNGVPDLDNQLSEGVVLPNQIGFLLTQDLLLVNKGEFAEVRFNLVPCPEKVKKYIYKWYNIKKTTSGEEKELAKAYLNLPIGYAQRTNPFFRSYVVNSCNKKIEQYLSNNSVILWNTDAIFSTEQLEMDIGNDIGQWKVEQFPILRRQGNTYQKIDDDPVYRGIPKAWFHNFEKLHGHKFILGEDLLPNGLNKYKYNTDTNRVEEIRYEQKS